MARLASLDVDALRSINPRWLKYLDAETAAINVTVSMPDVTVRPDATEARFKLSLSAAPRDTVKGSYLSRNGIGAKEGANYARTQGTFIFHPGGETEMEIVVPLNGNNAVGNTIEVVISSSVYGAKLLTPTARVRFSEEVPAEVKPGFALAWQTDFVAGFAATDSGFLADGATPCWQSRPVHGRNPHASGGLGFYADPALHAGTDPFPVVDGKRRLRSDRLATPITYKNVVYNYYTATLTSRKMAWVRTGDRIECRLAMPLLGKRGAWPAFWLLPTSGSWPPEIDMMEWPINASASQWIYYTTQHWVREGNRNRSYPIDIRELGVTENLEGFHTWGVTITEEELRFDLDGVKTRVMENRSPDDDWYILLDIEMGGSWPGAPTADTVFPAEMILDWIKVYEPS